MTSNCSRNMKWFGTYVDYASKFHRASITASLHTEHVNTKEKMQEFVNKLITPQEHDVQITINQVMVPEWFERDWENVHHSRTRNQRYSGFPNPDPYCKRVVDGYTDEMKQRLYNGMPQRAYTEAKAKQKKLVERPKPTFRIDKDSHFHKQSAGVPWHMQIEFRDKKGEPWYMDQAERFNAFNFNNFEGWECSSGYRSIIIREPDGSVKRSYSCRLFFFFFWAILKQDSNYLMGL